MTQSLQEYLDDTTNEVTALEAELVGTPCEYCKEAFKEEDLIVVEFANVVFEDDPHVGTVHKRCLLDWVVFDMISHVRPDAK